LYSHSILGNGRAFHYIFLRKTVGAKRMSLQSLLQIC